MQNCQVGIEVLKSNEILLRNVVCRYRSEQVGYIDTLDRSGLIVSFEREVEQTNSELQVDTITLLTRCGGIIGVGKNLLWIIIFVLSSFATSFTILKKYAFNTQ